MPTAKRTKAKQGSAARYRALKAERMERLITRPVTDDEPLFDVETPSGMVWQCRRPDILAFVEAGALPQSLALKMAKAAGRDPEQAAVVYKELTPEDQVKLLAFQASLVRFIAVDPRIVETPASDDEIGFDEVTQADFVALFTWASEGGAEAAGLGAFPGE